MNEAREGSGKGQQLVDSSGTLIGPARTVPEDGFWIGKESDSGRICVALPFVVRNDLNPMAQKWNERRNVVDEDVDSCVASVDIGPWADFVKKMIVEGDVPGRARFEDTSKRNQDARGKNGKEQDGRGWNGEPAGRQPGKEQNQKSVAGDCQPIDKGI